MIVVMILGILGAMAVPMFGQTSTTKLRQAANLLTADLAHAQNESIAHGDDLRVMVFDANTDTYFIAASSDTSTPVHNPVSGKPMSVTFGQGRAAQLDGVTIGTLSMDGDAGTTATELGFGLYGQTDQTTDATITLGCDGLSITVTVNASTGDTTLGPLQ